MYSNKRVARALFRVCTVAIGICLLWSCISEGGAKISGAVESAAADQEGKSRGDRTTIRELLAPILETSAQELGGATNFINAAFAIFDDLSGTQAIIIATAIIAIVALCTVLISGVLI